MVYGKEPTKKENNLLQASKIKPNEITKTFHR